MKWSVLAALFATPLAMAGALEADLAARTDMNMPYNDGYSGGTVTIDEVIVIWVCMGGGSVTTTMNAISSVTDGAAAATHTVTVGGAAGLVYTPETVEAAVGDLVIFEFKSQNHTASQSSFQTPCEFLPGGMDTGFMPNINNTVSPPPQMAMQVKVSTPLWFYCRQKSHCGKGMVFSINPTVNKTQEMFKQMAIAQNGTGTTAGVFTQTATSVAGTTMATVAVSSSSVASAQASQSTVSSVSGSGITMGSGYTGTGEACSCSCLCGVANFPSAAQGLKNFGGMSGAMPLAMMKK